MTAPTPAEDVQGEATPPEIRLSHAAMGGVAWQGFSYLLGKVLVLASTVVLARLLTPSDFGVVGLALVFIQYVEGITDLGVAEALVYMPSSDDRNDAVMVLSLIWSGLLTLVGVLAAPAVAGFFHRPDIAPMFRVLSLSLLVRGAAEVPEALLRKELRFRRRFRADLSRVVAQGVVSIALAATGFGPWAIVYGYLTASVVWGIVAWTLVPYRPGRRTLFVDRSLFRPLLAFGVPAAGNVILLSLVFDIDYLIVGRVLGPHSLGLYTLAFRIPELAIINVFVVLSAVAYPVFAKAGSDRNRLRRGYLMAVRLQSFYGMAAGVGMALAAPMLIHVVFGSRWDASIVPLEALSLYAAFRSLGIGYVDVLKAVGRTRLVFTLGLVRLVAVLPALLIAVRFGITGVSWAQAAVALVLAAAMQAVALRVLEVPIRSLAAALVPALAVAVGVAVGGGAVRLLMPGPEAVRLVAALVAGSIAGAGAVHAVDQRFLRETMALVLRRGPAASPATA